MRRVALGTILLALITVAMDSRWRGNDEGRKRVPNFRSRFPIPDSRLASVFSRAPSRESPSADGPGGRLPPRLSFAVLLTIALLWAGCGGGGGNVIHNPGTPAGDYLLSVTATTTSGTGATTQTVTLSLKVT